MLRADFRRSQPLTLHGTLPLHKQTLSFLGTPGWRILEEQCLHNLTISSV